MKVISIGMFVPGNQPVVWRGPMLHRALQQFLGDVFWGDLDVLLLDLPPGTGDIAISVAQLIPNAEILVVTTPQQAAAEVAERAGAIALQTHQRIVGVDREHVLAGAAGRLAPGDLRHRRRPGRGRLAHPARSVPRCRCSARSRSTPGCARAATTGMPVVLGDPDQPGRRGAARRSRAASRPRSRGLAGRSLGLTPAGR